MKYLFVLFLVVSPAFADDFLGVHVPLDELVMENGESFSKFFTREKNFDDGTTWAMLPLRSGVAAEDRAVIGAAIKIAERYVSVVAVLLDPDATGPATQKVRELLDIPVTTYLLRAEGNQAQTKLMAALDRVPAATLDQSAIVLDRDWRILEIIPLSDGALLKAKLAKIQGGFTRINRWLPIFIAFSIGFCLLCGAIFYQKVTEKESPASAR